MNSRETHQVEFKESWRDEHLKVVCAFANTTGGTVFIGKNDKGGIVGVSNSEKLMEDIPNQIKHALGIVVDVIVKREKGKDTLVIKIKPCIQPLSFRGKFYKRSGSTIQELNGHELQSFLLEKSATAWDSFLEEHANWSDINPASIKKFKDLAGDRLVPVARKKSDVELLEKLHLLHGRRPNRAAILLFGKDPQHFFPDAYIKIGRFKSDGTLIAMDDVRGNLFEQVEQTLAILKGKYLNTSVAIGSLQRQEDLEFPEVALREAVVNAVAHRDYFHGVTNIKIYPDQLNIWNNGELSPKLTLEKLKKKHLSFPRNGLIAEIFYKAGYIEKWGHGTVKMVEECKKAGLPEPLFELESGGIQVTFPRDVFTTEFLQKLSLNDRQIKAVLHVKEFGRITNSKYQELTGIAKRTASLDLRDLADKGVLRQTGVTGVGTQYTLVWGNQRAKGADKALKNALDRKIDRLVHSLADVSPEDEIRAHFGEELFFEILDSWLGQLFKELILVSQKFNRFFNEPRHHLFIINGIGQVEFRNEKPEKIMLRLKEDCRKSINKIYPGTVAAVNLFYGTFRKGGLKTFGCTYRFEIQFEQIKYMVFMDEFSETIRNKVPQFERLLHKPITPKEIGALSTKFGETILQHIDFHSTAQGLKKGQ